MFAATHRTMTCGCVSSTHARKRRSWDTPPSPRMRCCSPWGGAAPASCRQQSGTGIIEVTARVEQADARHTNPHGISPDRAGTRLPAAIQDHAAGRRGAEAARDPSARNHAGANRPQGQHPAAGADRRSARIWTPWRRTPTRFCARDELGTDGFFVFAVNRESADEFVDRSRMFCPALGIPEDPVSGNAHAMLAAYLWDFGQFGKNSAAFIGRQGRHMKRPGQVRCAARDRQGHAGRRAHRRRRGHRQRRHPGALSRKCGRPAGAENRASAEAAAASIFALHVLAPCLPPRPGCLRQMPPAPWTTATSHRSRLPSRIQIDARGTFLLGFLAQKFDAVLDGGQVPWHGCRKSRPCVIERLQDLVLLCGRRGRETLRGLSTAGAPLTTAA